MVRAAFLNVGQGDTTVVWNSAAGEAVIVDCVDPVQIWDLLQREGVRKVVAIVITHLHADHYAGLVSFLEGCRPRGIDCDAIYFHWISQVTKQGQLLEDSDGHSLASEESDDLSRRKRRSLFRQLAYWVDDPANRARYRDPSRLSETMVAGMKLEVLHPAPARIGRLSLAGRLNNLSVVVRICTAGSTALLTGDLEPLGWDLMVQGAADVSGDVLKFPHHGAWKRSDVDDVLDLVHPRLVVISVGTVGGKYDHPSDNVLQALRSRPDIEMMCTQVTGKCNADPGAAEDCVRGLLATAGNVMDSSCGTSGCPCASTVIIELGNPARVLQPAPHLHLRVIRDCLPAARCRPSS